MSLLRKFPSAAHRWADHVSSHICGGDGSKKLRLRDAVVSFEEDAQSPIEELEIIFQRCRNQNNQSLSSGRHAYVKRSGLKTQKALEDGLVHMSAEVGHIHDGQHVQGGLISPNVPALNSMIDDNLKRGKLHDALELFAEFQGDDTACLNERTCVALLRACVKLKNFGTGMQIHALVSENEMLKSDKFIGNALVDLYAKFGSLDKAKEIFDSLPVRDVVSWTALISAYSENGHDDEALRCFDQMQLKGVAPNAVTFVSALKACKNVRAMEKVQKLHQLAERRGVLTRNLMVGNTLINIYSDLGYLVKAQEVFDKLSVRNVVSWTVLIGGYVEHGYGKYALRYYDQMCLEGTLPDSYTVVSCLRACGNTGDVKKGQEIHAEVERKRLLQNDPFIGSALVGMYAKCGLLVNAQEVFDNLPVQVVVTWTTLISGYVEHGHNKEAILCFDKMQHKGICPNAVTYIAGLKACADVGNVQKGQEMHSAILKRMIHLHSNLALINSLVDMYAKCGLLTQAQAVFDKFPRHDSILYTALVAGYTEHGQGEEALKCFKMMTNRGIIPDSIAYVCTIRACRSIEAINRGRELHRDVVMLGLMELDFTLGDTMIDLYAKCGLLDEAKKVFDGLTLQNTVTWNALISGYTEGGLCDVALELFQQMRLEGMPPDSVSYILGLKSCADVGHIRNAREIHVEVQANGLIETDLLVGNALIDMYSKTGFLIEATNLFYQLPVRDVVSWSALITGYTNVGHSEDALYFFESMQIEDVLPNLVSFISSLKACSSLRAIDKAQEIHAHIEKKGFLGGDPAVGNTLVAMYASFGFLEEAQNVFNMLPSADVITWTTLIAGYSEHGYGERAMECIDKMRWKGVLFNAVTIVCSLKACGFIRDLGNGQEIHAEIERRGLLSRDLDIGNSLIDMYSECGFLLEARKVLDDLACRSTYAWNVLIIGYTECGNDWEALDCFEQMKHEGVPPDALTFICILKSSGRTTSVDIGHKLHAEIERKELLENNPVLGNALVGFYAKCGLLVSAQKVFHRLSMQDVVSWNILIAGFTEHGHCEEALNLLKEMRLHGIQPDSVTLICSSKACSSIGATNEGQEVHAGIERNELLQRHLMVSNSLINMYAKCGLMTNAQEVFDKIPVQDVVSWTALIEGYVEQDRNKEAMNSLEQMQHEGVSPDAVTYMCILKACGTTGASEKGKEIHSKISRKGFLVRNLALGNALIGFYAKCGLLMEARCLLDNLSIRSVVSWNTLIAGFSQYGEGGNVFQNFDRMVRDGIQPDLVTFVIVLNACNRTGLYDKSQVYFEAMSREHGIPPSFEHFTGMVDSLCRVGQLESAVAVVQKFPYYPSLVMWHIILSACKNWGNMELGTLAFWNALSSGKDTQ